MVIVRPLDTMAYPPPCGKNVTIDAKSPKLRNVSLRLRRNLMHEKATSPAPLTTRAALHEGARLTGATADARCSIIFAPTYFGSLRGVSRAVETRSRARRSS